MDPRKYLVMVKGTDQTSSVANFQLHDGTCEISYLSAPHKIYRFQSSNVEVFSLQKRLDPARFIVTVNGQSIHGIDELLDFGAYYRILSKGAKDQLLRSSEVQLQQNCLSDSKNEEIFQYFKETATAISLVAENGVNILSAQYNKIQKVSKDTVLASYLDPQTEHSCNP